MRLRTRRSISVQLTARPGGSRAPCLVAKRASILARLRTSDQHAALRAAQDDLRAAEAAVPTARDVMPHGAEVAVQGLGQALLDDHAPAFFPPEARMIDRGLHVHAVAEQVDQKLQMSLRLH